MARDVGICFRTTDEVKQALEAIAVIERRTLSSFIENVLRDHIKERVQLKDPGQERRRYFRKAVLLPALVYKRDSNGSAGMAGTVVDLSLVGLKIYIPHNCDIAQDEEFDTIFTIPKEKTPLRYDVLRKGSWNAAEMPVNWEPILSMPICLIIRSSCAFVEQLNYPCTFLHVRAVRSRIL